MVQQRLKMNMKNLYSDDVKLTMKDITEQENELVFDTFSNEDAYNLGTTIYMKAKKKSYPITIDITRCGHKLYHVAMPGTTPDNDAWIEGKVNVVMRFCHSSELIERYLTDNDSSMEEQYLLSSSEYRALGGSFPIIIKDTGVIGAVTVSGIVSDEAHMLVVNSIREFLKKSKEQA